MPKPRDHVWAVDALDEQSARVEEDGKRMLTIPRHLLPANAREGQLLRVKRTEENGVVTLTVTADEQATAAAQRSSAKLTTRTSIESKKHDPGGDVAL
jgi:hypothetical protein